MPSSCFADRERRGSGAAGKCGSVGKGTILPEVLSCIPAAVVIEYLGL